VAFRSVDDLNAVGEPDTGDTLGKWFVPFSRRQVFDAASTSLKTISFAIFGDSDPSVRTVPCRTVANTLSIGLDVRR
jgi:hypothetical protein